MISKNNNLPQSWLKFLAIFLVTILLSQINLPFLNDIRLIPDYFIALINPTIIFRFKKLTEFERKKMQFSADLLDFGSALNIHNLFRKYYL